MAGKFVTSGDGCQIVIQSDERYEVSYTEKKGSIAVKSPDFEQAKQLLDYALDRTGLVPSE